MKLADQTTDHRISSQPVYQKRTCNESAGAALIKFLRHARHASGFHNWETKNYETWLLLQNLLYITRPRTLVEFGSGRSTGYLAEYAFKYGAKLFSFEQHLYYFLRVRLGLVFSFLPAHYVKYVPIKDGWYDVRRVERHLAAVGDIEFFFYDGPTTENSGRRSSEKFYQYVVPLLNKVRMVIVDDVHRPDEERVAHFLAQKFRLKRFNITSTSTNTLAIMLAEPYADRVHDLPVFLKDLLNAA